MEMTSVDASSPSPIADMPDQHGFVMMGRDLLFLDHLAMFAMPNHRYQMIIRADLPAYAMNQDRDDRAAHSNDTYILGNIQYDLFTLPELQTGKRSSFLADVFRGVPEDPNTATPIIHNVQVRIVRVVYFHAFDNLIGQPPLLTYVLYGEGPEAHLSHLMIREPDYQQCIGVAYPPKWLSPAKLESGVTVNFPSLPYDGKTPCQNPLTALTYPATLQGEPNHGYSLDVAVNYYFDTASLNAMDPCHSVTA